MKKGTSAGSLRPAGGKAWAASHWAEDALMVHRFPEAHHFGVLLATFRNRSSSKWSEQLKSSSSCCLWANGVSDNRVVPLLTHTSSHNNYHSCSMSDA